MRRKLAIDPRQIEHRCNRTHLVIVRHHLFKAERIKTAVLDPDPTDPSWPVPAADRVNVRESLFAEAINRLLQQNRRKADIALRRQKTSA
jgi:hypothetical protein